jgi:hypothetical protein
MYINADNNWNANKWSGKNAQLGTKNCFITQTWLTVDDGKLLSDI